MEIASLFPTLVYRAALGGIGHPLVDECHALAASDAAGRRWSDKHYIGGYTSYGSLDRLHLVSSVFDALRRKIDPHAARFVKALHYDMSGRKLVMTDCWLNVMPEGVVHSLHLHPASFLSGTFYVAVPKGAGALKFEDPRLASFMATPPRQSNAPRRLRSFVQMPAKAGDLILFESWLRHEVPPARYAGERLSISFNYGWERASSARSPGRSSGRSSSRSSAKAR
jgi:uncharacterized protein (TIGR02466 family)